MYTYAAKCVRVVDGDTVFLNCDLGFRLFSEFEFRLAGINTPEMRGATRDAAMTAKARLTDLIVGKPLIVQTAKSDKYGRWLATIRVGEDNINQRLIDEGHAVPYMVDKI
jgi:micrococcal nuclease